MSAIVTPSNLSFFERDGVEYLTENRSHLSSLEQEKINSYRHPVDEWDETFKKIEQFLKEKQPLNLLIELDSSTVPEAKNGAFARKKIARGDPVVEYTGELVSSEDAEKNRGESTYVFTLNQTGSKLDCVIDAKFFGNESRYINDLGTPNLKACLYFPQLPEDASEERKKWWEFPRVFFIATRDLPPDHEFSVSYGKKEFWNTLHIAQAQGREFWKPVKWDPAPKLVWEASQEQDVCWKQGKNILKRGNFIGFFKKSFEKREDQYYFGKGRFRFSLARVESIGIDGTCQCTSYPNIDNHETLFKPKTSIRFLKDGGRSCGEIPLKEISAVFRENLIQEKNGSEFITLKVSRLSPPIRYIPAEWNPLPPESPYFLPLAFMRNFHRYLPFSSNGQERVPEALPPEEPRSAGSPMPQPQESTAEVPPASPPEEPQSASSPMAQPQESTAEVSPVLPSKRLQNSRSGSGPIRFFQAPKKTLQYRSPKRIRH